MSDLIDRQMAIDALGEEPEVWEDDDEYGMGQRSEWCHIKKTIEKLPTAHPKRKKGKWTNHRNDDGHNIADCDQCGNAIQWFDGDEVPRYCCMCGADMRGESDETD